MRPYFSHIDFSKRILEIGPLTSPVAEKRLGPSIFYADIRSTEEIKAHYAKHPGVDKSAIREVDYRIEGSYRASLPEKGVEPFDYVIASHVLEHIPLLLHFFSDIASVMNEGGLLCLTIPDGRYCFDHFRVPTSFAEAYDIHTHGLSRIAPRILESAMETADSNDPFRFWNSVDTSDLLPTRSFEGAKKQYEAVLAGAYIDAHFSVFTPVSFARLLHGMLRAALNPFRLAGMHATARNTFEFHVVLRKDGSLPGDAKKTAAEMIKLGNVVSALQREEFSARDFLREALKKNESR